jgi:hypothetical protein
MEKISRKRAIELIAAGDISGSDLSDSDLHGIDFSAVRLTGSLLNTVSYRIIKTSVHSSHPDFAMLRCNCRISGRYPFRRQERLRPLF